MKKQSHDCWKLFLFLPVLALTQLMTTSKTLGAQEGSHPQSPALAPRPTETAQPVPSEGRIHLDVVVTDKSGKPVSGLTREDFSLLDNNLPAKILSFRASDATVPAAGYPSELILVLDAVNVGFQTVSRSRDEISKFVRENGGHLALPVSVFLLTSDGVKVLVQPSIDGNALVAQLDQTNAGLRVIGRSGGFNGAVERFDLSLKWMSAIANSESKRPGRKLLVWVGSGWPLLDRVNAAISSKQEQQLFATVVELSTILREGRIALYSVSLGEPGPGTYLYQGYLKGVKTAEKVDPPDLALKVIATQSGGRVLVPDNDLTGQIETCVQDAGTFYTLSFDPPKADRANEYHDLKVEIAKPGLTARTNTGYYNQP